MVLGLPSLSGPQPRGFRRRGREAQRTIASAVRPLDNAQVGLWGPELRVLAHWCASTRLVNLLTPYRKLFSKFTLLERAGARPVPPKNPIQGGTGLPTPALERSTLRHSKALNFIFAGTLGAHLWAKTAWVGQSQL